MLTQAPLPGWLNLYCAMVRRPPSDAVLADPWHRQGEVAGWLSRSTWSLALIALWRQSRSPAMPLTVWLPDYFCNASLIALRQTGAKLVFYQLTADLLPDMPACRSLAGMSKPDLFLLVHYFGQPTPAASARDFCGHHGAWLIEDAAHVLKPVDGVGDCGDFVMYSPHKTLPVPDGAVLVVRPHGPANFGAAGLASFGLPVAWADQLRDLQQRMGGVVINGRVQAMVWLAKRVLQKFGLRSLRMVSVRFAEPVVFVDSVAPLGIPTQSGLAKRLLAGLISDLGDVARQRQRNQLQWDALLLGEKAKFPEAALATERSVSRAWTPYLGAYKVEDAATAQLRFDQWRELGLPVTTWPDLPPEVMKNPKEHANALRVRHTRVYLPVHQSLSARGMLKQLRPAKLGSTEGASLRVDWDVVSISQWQQWVAQVGRSNLLQSWAYGQAKSDEAGWQVKRGVFYRGNEIFAIVQVLQKRVAGVVLVSRINRGPLFLSPPEAQEARVVWTQLGRLGSLWRGRVLAVAPGLALSGSNICMMDDLGYRQFSPRAWESVWVDLRISLTTLRQNLDGKWRNVLVFSEKADLKLEAGCDDQLFYWMMARYKELMRDKDFSGMPVELLLALRKYLPADSRLIVMRAVRDTQAVAGICLVCHGSAATYLLGWNGPEGRKLKANQYLLWQAVVYLKQAGFDWFDLGGIDEDHTPGIAAFKLGLRGERYELVGEYWKL